MSDQYDLTAVKFISMPCQEYAASVPGRVGPYFDDDLTRILQMWELHRNSTANQGRYHTRVLCPI